MSVRKIFVGFCLLVVGLNLIAALFFPFALWNLVFTGPIMILGLVDMSQSRRAIRRNFPIFGHFRYLLEAIRPEINQYFIESNSSGTPFSREQRSLVYQRAKKVLDSLPFGTQQDVYGEGHEFLSHSMCPTQVKREDLRTEIGGPDCQKPYSASLFNISAMSYGSLSSRAVLALNGGAKEGDFAHNTGEGGISPYHLEKGGDLIWQIGTGYFGCRTETGGFDREKFRQKASMDNVKMIELKLSQGAKPGHGGILPADKVTPEIADIRDVPLGQDVVSPPAHTEFSTPKEMMAFLAELRSLSGGKPVGFKLCVGNRHEFIALCKAMVETGVTPDFIAVDGSEGGTGAAPLEFSNHLGTPGVEGLVFVHNILKGFDLRKDVKIMATGKVASAFGMIKILSLGADVVYSARAMMLAIGCIQALRCNSNHCPTGVATQNPNLVAGIHVPDKAMRVKNFHHETLNSVAHMLSSMGISHHSELGPHHIQRRLKDHKIESYANFLPLVREGDFLRGQVHEIYAPDFVIADSESFSPKLDGTQENESFRQSA